MKLNRILLTIMITMSGLSAQAADGVGTAVGNWLKLETGTRSIAMGGASVAAGEGISAVTYNPTSIGLITGSDTYYSKTNYIAGISHSVIGYGTQVTPNDFFGVHLFFLDSGPIERTTAQNSDGGIGDFNVYSFALRTTYTRVLTKRLKFGVTAKYIREQIDASYMQSVSLDIGSNFDTGMYGFILGMSASNLGPEVQFYGESLEVPTEEGNADQALIKTTDYFSLPFVFRLGLKNDIMGVNSEFIKNEHNRLTLAMDAISSADYSNYVVIGIEYAWRNIAFLRSGLHFGHDTAGLSLGGGLKYKVIGYNIGIDYAYVDYQSLDKAHQFGISLGF